MTNQLSDEQLRELLDESGVIDALLPLIKEVLRLRERVRELTCGPCHFCKKQTGSKEYAGGAVDIYYCIECRSKHKKESVRLKEQP